MVTDIEILGKFYELLNIPAITDEISGEVWTIAKPVGRSSEDIVINMLTSSEENRQKNNNGTININAFAVETQGHRADSLRLKLINDLIITSLGFVDGFAYHGQLTFELAKQKTFRDKDNNLMYYSNLRIDYTFKK